MAQLVQSILSNSTSYEEKYEDENVSAATTKVSVHVQVDLGPLKKRKKRKVRKLKNPSSLYSSTSTRQNLKSKSRVVSNASSKSKVPVVRPIRRKSKPIQRAKPKTEHSSSVSSLEDPAQNAAFLRKYFEESTRLANKKSSEVLVATAPQSEIAKGDDASSKKNKEKLSKPKPPWVDRFTGPTQKSSKRFIPSTVKKTSVQFVGQGTDSKRSISKPKSKKKISSTGSRNKIQKKQSASKSTINTSKKNSKHKNKNKSDQENSKKPVVSPKVNNPEAGTSTNLKTSADSVSTTASAKSKKSSTLPPTISYTPKSSTATSISGRESVGQEDTRKKVSFAGPGTKVRSATEQKLEHKLMRSDYGKMYQQKFTSKVAIQGPSGSAESNKSTALHHLSHLLRVNPLPPREGLTSRGSDVTKPDHQFKNIEEVINSKFSGHAARMKSIWEKTPYQPMTHARFRDMVSTYASPEAVIQFAKEGDQTKPMIPENLQTIKKITPLKTGPAVPSNLLTLPRPWEIKELLAEEENKDKTLKQLQGPPRNWQDSESTYSRINYDPNNKFQKEAPMKALREEVVVRGKPAVTGLKKDKYPTPTGGTPATDSSREMTEKTLKYYREAIYGNVNKRL